MTTNGHSVSSDADPSRRSAIDTVRAFIGSLEALDLDTTVELAAPEIRWVNAPLTSASNRVQFDKALRSMFKRIERFEVEYRDIHERSNGVVYTDRIDVAEGGGLKMRIDVRGELRVKDGLVVEWIDRFSWRTAISQIVKSLPRMVASRLRG